MAINRFSENYLLWANRLLFNLGTKMTIRTYIYHSWIFVVVLFPSTLFPVHVQSKSWRSTVAFVPSLSFLSGGTLDPRLSLCSFLSISTTCPGLPKSTLALSRPGAPGLLGCTSGMSTSLFVRHYYTMDKKEQAAKKRKVNDKPFKL